ncbi:MAG TPA: hypothetical protein VM695_05980, partial [Phycisphaerae bacterium]|nr:hypothetical protein [Phycisphaerae bacterium]
MIRPLACLLAMSMPALASTAGAPDAQAAAARVNELFGQAIRDAQASPGHDDNVGLARRLLDAAQHDSRQAEMAAALCDAAYGLASPAPQGLDLAAEAMELLAQRVPDRAADAAQKLLAIRRRQYGAAPASERPAMGERFIDSLTGVADALAAGGKYADAISYLRQAVSVAAGIRSARQ